jgi:hypothetical protein
MESNGDFVVSWDSLSDADSSFGVRAQRWSSAGAKLGVEFAVNTYTTSLQFGSAVGVDTDGDFVIAWTSIEHDGDSAQDVFGQRYNSSGARVGGEFQVNTASGSQFLTTFYAAPHALGIDTDGDFVVAWTSDIAPGLQGQRFASTGARIGGEFQVSVYSGTFHKRAATAMKANGDFVVAFNSYGRDDGGYAVFARRFTFVRELDIDDNGAVEPLTDGLLVLRRLFGFSGATLTAAAVGPNCGRCNAAAIEPYLDSLLPFLDIDASGEVGALTDGLLILRSLFGFSGSSLINGALTGDCTRCEAGAVAAYIDDL